MNDKVTSWLRTAVPALWGSAVAWLLAKYALPVEVADLLQSPVLTSAVVSVSIGAWYALFRWLEPRLPAWLTRIVLGSNSTPHYAPTGADGVPDVTSGPAVDIRVRNADEAAKEIAAEIRDHLRRDYGQGGA